MARVEKIVTTCDRHGDVEIDRQSEFLHVVVTPGKKTRGRTTRQALDLCEDCSKDFVKFMEGPEQGLTANQRVAEGMI